jgi:hypothetical protein
MSISSKRIPSSLWFLLLLLPASVSAGVVTEWDFRAFGGFFYRDQQPMGITNGAFPDDVRFDSQVVYDGDRGSLSWGEQDASHLTINVVDEMKDRDDQTNFYGTETSNAGVVAPGVMSVHLETIEKITTGDYMGEVIGWAGHHNLPNMVNPFIGVVAVNYHLQLFDPGGGATPVWDSGEMFFALKIWETFNAQIDFCTAGNGEANGQGVNINGCADQVSFGALGDFNGNGIIDSGDLDHVVFNDTFDETVGGFNYMGERYLVNLSGFWEDAQGMYQLVGEGWAAEDAFTHFDVRAQVYVPAPATGLLFGAGLAALGLSRRRRVAH